MNNTNCNAKIYLCQDITSLLHNYEMLWENLMILSPSPLVCDSTIWPTMAPHSRSGALKVIIFPPIFRLAFFLYHNLILLFVINYVCIRTIVRFVVGLSQYDHHRRHRFLVFLFFTFVNIKNKKIENSTPGWKFQ